MLDMHITNHTIHIIIHSLLSFLEHLVSFATKHASITKGMGCQLGNGSKELPSILVIMRLDVIFLPVVRRTRRMTEVVVGVVGEVVDVRVALVRAIRRDVLAAVAVAVQVVQRVPLLDRRASVGRRATRSVQSALVAVRACEVVDDGAELGYQRTKSRSRCAELEREVSSC